MTTKHKCVICGKMFQGYGNNPQPLAQKGRCCDNCNYKVIATRLEDISLLKKTKKMNKKKEEIELLRATIRNHEKRIAVLENQILKGL